MITRQKARKNVLVAAVRRNFRTIVNTAFPVVPIVTEGMSDIVLGRRALRTSSTSAKAAAEAIDDLSVDDSHPPTLIRKSSRKGEASTHR
jgi:hypothetical protein